jgi:molybdopterin-containing oxidoreductase family iron-sulfur binding subunit
MSRRKPYEFSAPASVEKPMWRSLEERSLPEAEKKARAEAEAHEGSFLDLRSVTSRVTRRGFLGATGASAAATLLACDDDAPNPLRRPVENILPYGDAPEHIVPGVPLHFATVSQRHGDAMGILVTSHEGRPTKVEGNPRHPASADGATDLWAQASIMDLYDPDRSRGPARRAGETLTDATFEEFDEALSARLAEHDRDQGRGLRVLAMPSTSPTFLRARAAFLARFPEAKVYTWAAVSNQSHLEGARLAYGRPLHAHHNLGGARVILSLDCDFLQTESGAVLDARRFADGRRLRAPGEEMNRLYVVEAQHSVTGSNADHRLRLPASQVARYLRALARELVSRHDLALDPAVAAALGSPGTEGIPEKWIAEVARELKTNSGRCVLLAGLKQPPAVHALVHALNEALDNLGRTVVYTRTLEGADAPIDHAGELATLASEMSGVRTLLILGANPVYDAPSDVGFVEKLGSVETTFHVGTHRDETAEHCTWHAPLAHELETWGDLTARDGTLAIQQPLIAPLWGGRSAIEVLAFAAGERNWRGHSMVRRTLRQQVGAAASFERTWRAALHAGIVAGSTSRPEGGLTLAGDAVGAALRALPDLAAPSADALEVVFAPCAKMLDGRYANNLWLQELPDHLSKLVWDNAAFVSPATANELGLADGNIVTLSREGAGEIETAVFRLPGTADNTLALTLGWGRSAAGRYGNGQGFDVNPLRTTDAFWFAGGVRLAKTNRNYLLVRTQEHGSMEGRPVAIDATLDEYREHPDFPQYRAVEMDIPPLWDRFDYAGKHKWGMSIDLTACTGCNACVVACQSENNIPVVGKGQVARGREMYWIRIDRYFVGDDENEPEIAVQPIACQQCEEAPCENVCPVNATAHSPEGLNDMAYNRCIGTRYCANNCPYKVRRYNYLSYHNYIEDPQGWYEDSEVIGVQSSIPETRQMAFNPNVTVRMRGVMEKCTYCVQRIQEAKIASRRDDRPIADGSLRTACQQTCPTQAITFGDLNGYPYVVRKGSRLVGMNAQQISQELELRDVRIEREPVVPEGAERGEVSQVDTIEDSEDFQQGKILYTVYSSTRLPELQGRDRHYKLLVELGTHPRTTFLARIRNTNPEMVQ